MRYRYLGDRWTPPEHVGMACDPVRPLQVKKFVFCLRSTLPLLRRFEFKLAGAFVRGGYVSEGL